MDVMNGTALITLLGIGLPIGFGFMLGWVIGRDHLRRQWWREVWRGEPSARVTVFCPAQS